MMKDTDHLKVDQEDKLDRLGCFFNGCFVYQRHEYIKKVMCFQATLAAIHATFILVMVFREAPSMKKHQA